MTTYDDLRNALDATPGYCQCEPDINYSCEACHVEAEREIARELIDDMDRETGEDIDHDLRKWGEGWKV